jgi:hypothetical protein
MIKGTLIAESLRVGTTLGGVSLIVREIRRFASDNLPSYQPKVWTVIESDADDAEAGKLAGVLAEILDEPGWYANFSSPGETFVIYPGRVFRYPRGDGAGRAEARAYGRTQGVPEPQLDWSE